MYSMIAKTIPDYLSIPTLSVTASSLLTAIPMYLALSSRSFPDEEPNDNHAAVEILFPAIQMDRMFCSRFAVPENLSI